MKVAIVVLADPAGGDDSLGRMFNGLATAKDFAARGDDVDVIFQGAGTRWLSVLADAEHPAHDLYGSVRHLVAGASSACTSFFGAQDGVAEAGLELIDDNPIEGVGGVASLARLAADGATVLTF